MEIPCKNVSEAVEKVIYHVIWNHYDVITEDGEHTWQADPITIVVDNPASPEYKHPKIPYGDQFYQEYIDEIVKGKNAGRFDYDYYSRLNHYDGYPDVLDDFLPVELTSVRQTNQIEYIVNKLRSQSASRRAVAITWEPWKDTEGNESVPCLQYIQCWMARGKMNMSVLFRSEDMLLGYPQNIVGLTNLQMYIARQLGIKVGKYYHFVTIPHIYNLRDANYLKPWLGE